MKKIKKILVLFISVLVLTSCEDDFFSANYLDKTPEADLTIEDIFSNRNNTEAFLVSIYSNLFNQFQYSERSVFTGASDELEPGYGPAFSHQINSGAWSPDFNGVGIWDISYEAIRKANIFLENIENVPMDPQLKEQWKGQAIFLRAFYHFFIFRIVGPVPVIDRTIQTDEDFTEFKRQSVEEVVNFIVNECDRAAEILDINVSSSNKGQATKAAALALKARVLLYFASPLYNGNPDYQNFTDNDGEHLFPTSYNNERWQQAAQAAKDAIDQSEAAGYGLYKSEDNNPVKSYQEIFTRNWNKEVLFAKTMGTYSHFDRSASPLGMGGYSSFCPTQNIVDAYEMENGELPILGYNSDGSPIINVSSGYTEQGYASQADPEGYYPEGISNMYVNRDPRFYASINFNGQFWKTRQLELWFTGFDGRRSGGAADNLTTGYLIKKFADPEVRITEGKFVQKAWIFFRLAEQYLNYAEALNESEGPVDDVYSYMNGIRNRAGMPPLKQGLLQDEMRERIRHERRIELAFESHRYFDTHRWKIAEETQSGPIYGMTVTEGDFLQDDAFYQRRVIENRVFVSPKHYLWPIEQSEINKNPNLVQNPGW